MQKQYKLRIDMINMLMRYMVAFTIIGMVTLLVRKDSSFLWKSFALLPVGMVIHAIEKFSKQAWIYFTLNLFFLALYLLFINNLLLQILYGIYILIEVIVQFIHGRQRESTNTSPFFMLMPLAMYLYCKDIYTTEIILSRFIFYVAILYALIFILNMYYLNFHVFFQKYEGMMGIPLKQIKLSNSYFISSFLFLCFIGMILLSNISYNGVVNAIWKMIKFFIAAFVRFLSSLAEDETEPIMEEEEKEIINDDMGMEEVAGEPSEFMIFLSEILYYAAVIVIITAIIILIIYSLYRLYRYFYQKKFSVSKEEKIEFISPFQKENTSIYENRKTSKRKFLAIFTKTNNERIRKHYYKAIVNHAKSEEVLPYLAPIQLSKYAFTSDNPILKETSDPDKESELTNLYEKARYSDEECSKTEVMSVKNLLK